MPNSLTFEVALAQTSPQGQIGLALLGTVLLVGYGLAVASTERPKKKPTYKVVSTYKGCDTVRYETGGYPQYVYFLDCSSKTVSN